MDYALLNLVVTFALFVLTFVFRKRILTAISRVIGPYILHSVVQWAFVEEEQESEDGTKVKIKALSGPAKGLLASTVPLLLAEAMKSIKLKLPAGPIPNLDPSNLAASLPQLIMAMPGRNLNLGGFKLPKEVAAALSSLASGFLGGKGAAAPKSGTQAVPKELEL